MKRYFALLVCCSLVCKGMDKSADNVSVPSEVVVHSDVPEVETIASVSMNDESRWCLCKPVKCSSPRCCCTGAECCECCEQMVVPTLGAIGFGLCLFLVLSPLCLCK